MSATESLLIGLERGVPVPPPITDASACAADYALDYGVNWRSPYRPAYQCTLDEAGAPACVRRGTFGGVAGGGYGVTAVTSVLAPRAFPLYPSCETCMEACADRASGLPRPQGL